MERLTSFELHRAYLAATHICTLQHEFARLYKLEEFILYWADKEQRSESVTKALIDVFKDYYSASDWQNIYVWNLIKDLEFNSYNPTLYSIALSYNVSTDVKHILIHAQETFLVFCPLQEPTKRISVDKVDIVSEEPKKPLHDMFVEWKHLFLNLNADYRLLACLASITPYSKHSNPTMICTEHIDFETNSIKSIYGQMIYPSLVMQALKQHIDSIKKKNPKQPIFVMKNGGTFSSQSLSNTISWARKRGSSMCLKNLPEYYTDLKEHYTDDELFSFLK